MFPNMTNHWGDKRVESVWQDLVGQRMLKLDQPESICELIASTIGLAEGVADIDSLTTDLTAAGVDASGAASVTRALATVGAGGKKGDDDALGLERHGILLTSQCATTASQTVSPRINATPRVPT